MKPVIYGIKNCDSVKKARKFFDANQIDYDYVDFKSTPVDEKKVTYWLAQNSLKKLLNTRGTTYRNLQLKSMNLDEQDSIRWMAKENLLIKRPVIEYNDGVIVAFDESEYERVFLS